MMASVTGLPFRCNPLLLPLLLPFLRNRRKPDYSWSVDDAAVGIEPRAVTWTVPGFLGVIPVHDTIKMGADGGALVNGAALITVDRDLSAAATDDSALARLYCRDVVLLTLGEIILVLLGDVDVFSHVFRSRLELDAGWVVESHPLVLSSL